MKLAYYYHVTINSSHNEHSMPGYLGVFIDTLASMVDELYVIYHQANEVEALECDYILQEKNIKFIDLGKKTPAWHRAIFYNKILKKPLEEIKQCDVLIVRSPSPLAPYFSKYFKKVNGLFLMIVGDYIDGAEHLKSSTFRDKMIYQYLRYNDILFKNEIKRTNLIVNSVELLNKYHSISNSIDLIKTTTLSDNDFYQREDTCQFETIELLYTGRIDVAKGLIELLEATNILIKENYKLILNIVGWEPDSKNRLVENKMKSIAKKYGIEDQLIFHGRKAIGHELNIMYQHADIYIIPSYHEGFPRTIWEAMANSLPVIATKVGGIPSYLTHNENVYLIEPKDVNEIVNSIKVLINDNKLRRKIIRNAFVLAKENTLEVQTKLMLSIIKKRVISHK
jgi:glycosyltransferase involved in cell wall biosynthesis